MCLECFVPAAAKPEVATCNRCGYEGTCWVVTRRLIPPRVPWPRWDEEHVCMRCILFAHIAA